MGAQAVKHHPRVSVLMAAYNRERFVAAAVESVLAQDFDDFELVVVDDGSTDRTPEIIAGLARRDSRIRLLRQENAGVAAARNTALTAAAGEFVAIMDSDDLVLPERLRLQVAFLDRNPGVAGVGSRYFYIDAQGNKTGPRRYVRDPGAEPMALPSRPEDVRCKLLEKGVLYFLHSTATFRAQPVRRLGGYRPLFAAAEDSDLHLRLLTAGHELANLKEVLFLYRQGGGNLSVATLPVLIQRMAALAAAHRRILGLSDLIDGRTEPFDFDFLMALMRPVPMAVWLEWIGLLQYHKNFEAGMLGIAWRQVLAMDDGGGNRGELLRHWRGFAAGWPEEAERLGGPRLRPRLDPAETMPDTGGR